MPQDSQLDAQTPITALQSGTVRSALIAMAPQIALVLTQVTGKAFSIDIINDWINDGYSIVASVITIYYCYRAIRGRINATQTIAKGK